MNKKAKKTLKTTNLKKRKKSIKHRKPTKHKKQLQTQVK